MASAATASENRNRHTMVELTGFQRDCLAVIADLGLPHGLAIKTELEQMGYGEVNHGRMYPNLDTLADKGVVKKGEKDDRTNEYEITRAGKQAIAGDRDYYEAVLEGSE